MADGARWSTRGLAARSDVLQWDTPSPYEVKRKMMVKVDNLGGSGQVAFALQELVDGGFWATVSTVELDASPGDQIMTSFPSSPTTQRVPALITVSWSSSMVLRWTGTAWIRCSSRQKPS